MAVLVQKYGGSSVADEEKLRQVARRVVAAKARGYDVVVVVSAMGGTTDHLLALAGRVSAKPQARELDMLVTAGERISIALLSMAICDLGFHAISFTGSQSGILTNDSHNRAKIVEVRPFRIRDELDAGRIVIVAGYQGVSYRREITSLGRGGTDATAVALAAALGAEACEIYSDVDGVYSADPRIVVDAHRLDAISYDEMLALSRHGARVMNADAVDWARRHGIALFARATTGPEGDRGTLIRLDPPGDPPLVTGVALRSDIWRLQIAPEGGGTWGAGDLLDLIEALAEAGLQAEHLSGGASGGARGGARGGAGAHGALDLLLSEENHPGLEPRLASLELPGGTVVERSPLHTVTLVGHAIAEDPGILAAAVGVARQVGSSFRGVLIEPLALTFLLNREPNPRGRARGTKAPELARALHRRFLTREVSKTDR